MTRLYVVPVGEWIDRFTETVAEPVSVPENAPEDLQKQSEVRIWGTDDGDQKRTYFNEMETGDPLLFYHDGSFFAAGRVGVAFNSQDVAETLWDNAESQFIYTVTDYQEISVDRAQIATLLGYEENWVPYRFLRVSDDAVSSLLREYNSIEEAFQDFHNGGTIEPPETGGDDDDPREHTEIQWSQLRDRIVGERARTNQQYRLK